MLSYDVECSIFFPNFMDKFMAMEGEFTQNDWKFFHQRGNLPSNLLIIKQMRLVQALITKMSP